MDAGASILNNSIAGGFSRYAWICPSWGDRSGKQNGAGARQLTATRSLCPEGVNVSHLSRWVVSNIACAAANFITMKLCGTNKEAWVARHWLPPNRIGRRYGCVDEPLTRNVLGVRLDDCQKCRLADVKSEPCGLRITEVTPFCPQIMSSRRQGTVKHSLKAVRRSIQCRSGTADSEYGKQKTAVNDSFHGDEYI